MTQEYRTRQELLDNAYHGVLSQGALSLTEKKYCIYRGPNGTRCGIGWSIDDDAYDESLEHKLANHEDVMQAARIAPGDEDWACDLQFCHDISVSLYDFKAAVMAFAAESGMTITPYDQWKASKLEH